MQGQPLVHLAGLPQDYLLTQLMGGELTASNRAGGGARFLLDLPLRPTEPAFEPIRVTPTRVLIVDDVMSAGTAAKESIALIRAAGATPFAVAIALDRQEKAVENGVDVNHSAVQFVRGQLGLQVCAIAKLDDLMHYLAQQPGTSLSTDLARVQTYRQQYGVVETP